MVKIKFKVDELIGVLDKLPAKLVDDWQQELLDAPRIVIDDDLSGDVDLVDISLFKDYCDTFNNVVVCIQMGSVIIAVSESVNSDDFSRGMYVLDTAKDMDYKSSPYRLGSGFIVGLIKIEKLPRFYLFCRCGDSVRSIVGPQIECCMRTHRTAVNCEFGEMTLKAIKMATYAFHRFADRQLITKTAKKHRVSHEPVTTDSKDSEVVDSQDSYIYINRNKVLYNESTYHIADRKKPGKHDVRGHTRRYKDGKIVFINGHTRGKGECKAPNRIYIIK
jgi:hypothetical protein